MWPTVDVESQSTLIEVCSFQGCNVGRTTKDHVLDTLRTGQYLKASKVLAMRPRLHHLFLIRYVQIDDELECFELVQLPKRNSSDSSPLAEQPMPLVLVIANA